MHIVFKRVLALSVVGIVWMNTAATYASDAAAPIVIYRDPARYVAFPDVKRLPDGKILCVFRDAPFPERVSHIEVGARIVGVISEDEGRTWSRPQVIFDDEGSQNDASFAVLRDGRLLMTFFTWDGVTEAYVEKNKPPFARRVDHGDWGVFAVLRGAAVLWGTSAPLRWEKDARHVTGDERELRATSSAVLETRDKTLLMPTYGRSRRWTADRAFVLRSTDAGATWGDEITMAADPEGKIDMQEPTITQTRGGDIVALLRTANAEDHLYTVRSADDGKTWSAPERTPLIGHPADLMVLPDGRVFAVFGYRHKPFGVRACVSDEHGRTWDADRVMVIADRGDHHDLGYPSVCLTGDEHVLIAYYMNGPDTRDRWIECRRLPLKDLR